MKKLRSIQKELDKINISSDEIRSQLASDLEIIKKLPPLPQPKQNFKTEGLIYETLRGEKVRSKSEAIIADALFRHKINYQYEKVLEEDGFTHIDFTIKDNIQGKTIYWEHFGRMNDIDYIYDYLKKKKHYENLGIVEGKNLIATYEFYKDHKPEIHFDARQAEMVVLKYFDVPAGGK